MNLRVRSKAGVLNLRSIDKNTTLNDFKLKIEKDTGIPAISQKILSGFPPKEIQNSSEEPIGGIFSNGDVITVEHGDSGSSTGSQQLSQPTPATNVSPSPITSQPQQSQPQQSQPQQSQPPQSSQKKPEPESSASAPGIVNADEGCVIRRVIPDDNSCLFHAISYVLENKANDKISKLRNLVSKEIASDPYNYNEGILGKKPADYQRWITQNTSWGGSVELNIFAKHYKTEIMAYDVTRKRGNCFAEDQGYSSRVYLLYDGIHYDCLVWNILPSQPAPDFDVTIFNSKDTRIEKEFEKFMEKEHASGKFVDEYNYTLKCEQCKKLFKGNNEATAHAKTTGHTQFSQNSN
jgi:ubiquitin thioesterase OTU1